MPALPFEGVLPFGMGGSADEESGAGSEVKDEDAALAGSFVPLEASDLGFEFADFFLLAMLDGC